jgi:hypothetical protein
MRILFANVISFLLLNCLHTYFPSYYSTGTAVFLLFFNRLRDDEIQEHFNVASFSPLHIPDEEAVDMARGFSPPTSPIPSIHGMASDLASPM